MSNERINKIKEGLLKEYDMLLPHQFSEIENPDWNSGGRVHNWHNYIPNICIDLWDELPEEMRIVLYVMADDLASEEVWD